MIDPGQPLIIEKFTGVHEETLDVELASYESSDNQNVETDEINGILTKKLGFKKIGNLGSVLLLDDCEATTNWTFSAGVTGSADTANPIIGTKDIKMILANATIKTGIAAYKAISSTDLSVYAGVGFYIQSTVALTAGDYQFCIDDTAALASPIETVNIPAVAANVWQYVYVPFANAGSTRTAIISFGIILPYEATIKRL